MTNRNVAVFQKIWGWKMATHLFLVGSGAGTYIVGFILRILHPESEFIFLSKAAIAIAVLLIIVGAVFIITNLGHKTNAVYVFMHLRSSWLGRGIVALILLILLGLIHVGVWLWPFTELKGLSNGELAFGIIIMIVSLFTLIYSGMLLKSSKPIAFWNNLFLPLLFLVSGLSAGIMVIAIILSIKGLLVSSISGQQITLLLRYNVFIIIIQAVILGLYLWRAYQIADARNSVVMLIKGNLTIYFWTSVIAAGLVIPFIFTAYQVYASVINPVYMIILTLISSVIGLVGGFMLRYIVLVGGTSIALNVEGIPVPLPAISRVTVSKRVTY